MISRQERLHLRTCVLFLLTSSGLVTPFAALAQAQAQPQPNAAAAPLDQARVRFRAGVRLFEDRDFVAALTEFQAAYQLSQEPVALYNIALSQKALMRYADAVDTLDQYLKLTATDPKVTAAQRQAVEQSIVEMRSSLAEIRIRLTPSTGQLEIDGRPADPTRPTMLGAGRHVVRATAPGFESVSREIQVVTGLDQDLTIQLVPSATTAAPSGGSLQPRTDVTDAAYARDSVGSAPEAAPIHRRWWFWGAVAAAVAAGTVAAVVAAGGNDGNQITGTLGSSKIP